MTEEGGGLVREGPRTGASLRSAEGLSELALTRVYVYREETTRVNADSTNVSLMARVTGGSLARLLTLLFALVGGSVRGSLCRITFWMRG